MIKQDYIDLAVQYCQQYFEDDDNAAPKRETTYLFTLQGLRNFLVALDTKRREESESDL